MYSQIAAGSLLPNGVGFCIFQEVLTMVGKVKIVCRHCGSKNVRRDAYAEWDVETQLWVCGNVYDEDVWCADCEAENDIEAVPAD